MKIKMPAKITAKLSLKLSTPVGEGQLWLSVADNDNDNDPEVKIEWDLPGTLLDSPKGGVTAEIPAGQTVAALVASAAATARALNAPDLVVQALEAIVIEG